MMILRNYSFQIKTSQPWKLKMKSVVIKLDLPKIQKEKT